MENNQKNSFKNRPHPFLFWGACFILLLPIIVLPPTFQPAEWSRAILFRIALTIIASFLFFRFFYKKDLFISLPKWKAPVYLPLLVLFAFFIILILSTVFSEDIWFSIFGSPSRAGGLLNLLFYFIFAVFLALFIDKNNWKKLFNFLFAAGVLISLLGIIQYFNLFKDIFLSYEGGGAPSFLGNSTFLAIYMLFLAIFSFTLFTQEKGEKKKLAYLSVFLLFLLTIIITGSRAAYLAMVASFSIFFFFYPKKFKNLKITAVSILLIAFLVIILFNLFPQQLAKNNILSTISNRLSLKTIAKDLLGTRFEAWKMTVEAIKDKPILGYGPENFYIGFEKHYDSTVPNFHNLWWDRPHNVFLEIAASSGLFALIFYLAFWIGLLWQLQKFKRKQEDSKETYLAHGLQAMFLGYLVVLFFNFDSFATYLISFFFVGYAFYLLSAQDKTEITPWQKSFFNKKAVAGFCLLPVVLFLWFWNIKPLYINEKLVSIQIMADTKKCDKAMIEADGIWKNAGILKSYSALKYTEVVKKCSQGQKDKEVEYVLKGYAALKSSSAAQPKFTRTWLFLGAFTNVLAAKEQDVKKQKQLLFEALTYLDGALKLSPGRQEIILEIEKNYLIAKNYEAMKKIAYDCIKIDSNYGECYWYLGIAEIFLGDVANGKIHAKEGAQKRSATPAYIQLAVAYLSQKDYTDAIDAYELAIVSSPPNASYHAALAFLYRKVGRYAEAGQEAIKVFNMEPENKDVMEFIQALLGLSPNDPNLHSSLAYIYNKTGKTEKARQEYLIVKSYYEQALAYNPKNPDYHFSLAGVYNELKEYEKAYREAITTEKLNPKLRTKVSSLIYNLPDKNYWERYQKDIQ